MSGLRENGARTTLVDYNHRLGNGLLCRDLVLSCRLPLPVALFAPWTFGFHAMKLQRPDLFDLLLIAIIVASLAILLITYSRTDMKLLERKLSEPHSAEPH